MNEKVGKLTRAAIGIVEEINVEQVDVAWDEFIIIKVCLDISKPLMRGKRINCGQSLYLLKSGFVTWLGRKVPIFYFFKRKS